MQAGGMVMDELRALRWYEGDVTGNDPLWADSKAYVTLNAIFFDGIENEMIKAKENKHLNPALLSRWQELLHSSLLTVVQTG